MIRNPLSILTPEMESILEQDEEFRRWRTDAGLREAANLLQEIGIPVPKGGYPVEGVPGVVAVYPTKKETR